MKKKSLQIQKIAIGFRFTLDFCFARNRADFDIKNRKFGERKQYVQRLRAILEVADRLNAKGVMLKITWTMGGDSSFQIMRRICPDLLEHIRYRVDVGFDEINDYSRNEALLPMLSPLEFSQLFVKEGERVSERLLEKNHLSFAEYFKQIEPYMPLAGGVYSPALLPFLAEAGVKGISFNLMGLDGTSCHDLAGELTFSQRYNPVWLTRSGAREKTIFLPSLSIADIVNQNSLKRMVLELREEQLTHPKASELFLLFDEYLSSDLLFDEERGVDSPDFCCLEKMVNSIAMLPFVIFTTPAHYLSRNTPRGVLVINRDLIAAGDGSLSPWADKWENRELWSIIERSRLFCDKAVFAAKESGHRRLLKTTMEKVVDSRLLRLKVLEESYFGPNSQTKRVDHVEGGLQMARESEKLAIDALEFAFSHAKKSRDDFSIDDFREGLKNSISINDLVVGENSIENSFIKVEYSQKRGIYLRFKDFLKGSGILHRFAVNYGGRILVDHGSVEYISTQDGATQMLIQGSLRLSPGTRSIKWKYIYTIQVGQPYLFLNVQVEFPSGESLDAVGVEGAVLDSKLYEIMPSELILPEFSWKPESMKIWKDSPLSTMESQVSLKEHFKHMDREFILNSSFTRHWMAGGIYSYGLLVAQKLAMNCSFSFCPMRFVRKGQKIQISFNPMGSYLSRTDGKQYRTFAARMLFKKWNRRIYAPASSYGGRTLNSSFMIAPFKSGQLPDKVIQDAVAFSTQINLSKTKDKEFKVTG